jgi:anti-sigma B factor antagonist
LIPWSRVLLLVQELKRAALFFGIWFPMSTDGECQSLSITVDGTVIAVSGELDVASAPELDDLLRRTDGEAVTLDLSGVRFIDPAGLRVLLVAQRDIDARGGQLVIRQPSWPVRRLAQLSGTTDQLGMEGSAEAE